MQEIYPYRFRATGRFEGTTLIYYEDRTVISYRTEDPREYYVRFPGLNGMGDWDSRHTMTANDLARFEAIPTLDELV